MKNISESFPLLILQILILSFASESFYFSSSPQRPCQQHNRFLQHGDYTNRFFLVPQQLGEFELIEEEVFASCTTKDDEESGNDHTNGLQHKKVKTRRRIKLIDFISGDQQRMTYQTAWDFQKELLNNQIDRITGEIKSSGLRGDVQTCFSSQWLPTSNLADEDDNGPKKYQGDCVIMLQHNPVYTLGTGSDVSFIKDNPGFSDIEIVRIERGGEVTYHGPGQLVVYPILDLRGYKRDIHWYMRALEESIILALQYTGISDARREDDVTGVWVKGKKVAAIGVKVRRWVTMHGIAVNISNESLGNFGGIVPCGLEGRDVGCVNDFLRESGKPEVTLKDFAENMSRAFEEVFKAELVSAS